MPDVLKRSIEKMLSEISQLPNSIIVLKGVPMNVIYPEYAKMVDLDALTANKLAYLLSVMKDRTVVTYEEFLLLFDFIVSQFSAVYILNNNIYMDQYPLDLRCGDISRDGLLKHFMEVEDDRYDEMEIGPVQELASLYVGIKEFNGYLIGS